MPRERSARQGAAWERRGARGHPEAQWGSDGEPTARWAPRGAGPQEHPASQGAGAGDAEPQEQPGGVHREEQAPWGAEPSGEQEEYS